jgi:hypothetical protein
MVRCGRKRTDSAAGNAAVAALRFSSRGIDQFDPELGALSSAVH